MDERNKKYPGLQLARQRAAELSKNPDSYKPNLSDMDSEEIEEYNKREERRKENISKKEQEQFEKIKKWQESHINDDDEDLNVENVMA